ncbi:MAG TPA: M48 family metalloprotease [Planktothrix sp.]|jgi:heat shock protein HtpX
MSRHRVVPFDDPSLKNTKRRLLETWLKTIAGYLAMGGLIFAALKIVGASYHFQLGWGLFYIIFPFVSWWFSAKISLMMTKSVPADPNIPEHKRLIDIVHKTWTKTGLKYEPPVYISDNPLPNAFATGPIHSKAVVAATKGLFLIGLTDQEIEAVFSHEFGHVYHYDVGINSFLGMLSSFFFLIVNAGVNALLGSINIFRRPFKLKPLRADRREQYGFIGNIINYVAFYIVFQLTGQLTKLIQMFVVRSRESAADAYGAYITKNPCALATALEKLVAYVENHRPQGQQREFWRALRPMMTIDPLYDAVAEAPKPQTLWQKIRAFYQWLMLTHPTVPDRVHQLERMNGGACPKISS